MSYRGSYGNYNGSYNQRGYNNYNSGYNPNYQRNYNQRPYPPKRKGQQDDFRLPRVDWKRLNLPPFKKNFYKEHPKVTERSEIESKRFLNEKEITVRGNCPKPISSFEESGLPRYILNSIKNLGFDSPTPIQCQSWPIVLSGRDMIGIAATGSGKTLAFLIPSIIHINAQEPLSRGDSPIALVIAPTRELATQIQNQIPGIAASSKITYTTVYGGVPKYHQTEHLRRGVEIVVATPGRLLDFIQSGITNLKRVTYLVLDEADRMLDMGFEKPIRQILSQIRPERQTLLFSATWPKEIQSLAAEILDRPIHVNIGSLGISTCKNVKQEFEVVDDYKKEMKLLFYLKHIEPNEKVLVFVATKVLSNSLCQNLRANGFYCAAINGDKRQAQREQIMSQFRSGQVNILIGTDVASRGLDIKDIRVVINYDFPNTIEDYVHRIGRTGRADSLGKSYTLLTRKNANKVGDLIELLKNDKKEIPIAIQQLYDTFGRRNMVNRYKRKR